ncbi:MAG TPA: cytochrome C assembly protein [Porphyromonadaceae bacterium]|nr:cytochrome C assembly protein [Porphyromonadaceae bacterium]
MTWDSFIYFALAAVVFWAGGAFAAWKGPRRKAATWLTVAGLLVFFAFIAGMWLSLQRPPLRTMGETRLWYSFFLSLAGLITYQRWRYNWILSFSTVLATVFVMINLLKPEIHNTTLMPALQSPWFAPHVIIYMFSYAMLGAATLVAIYYLVKKGKPSDGHSPLMATADNLVYVGMAFLTMGMLIGAIWAKEAWGHYWSWDPKETWAAATWLGYLLYIHYRLRKSSSDKLSMYMLILAFILLQICWVGVNYLPSAKGRSVHSYTMNYPSNRSNP